MTSALSYSSYFFLSSTPLISVLVVLLCVAVVSPAEMGAARFVCLYSGDGG